MDDVKILELMSLAFGQNLSGRSLAVCTPETVQGWDSIAFLNLISLLEEAFDISIEIEDIAKMTQGGVVIREVVAEKTRDSI